MLSTISEKDKVGTYKMFLSTQSPSNCRNLSVTCIDLIRLNESIRRAKLFEQLQNNLAAYVVYIYNVLTVSFGESLANTHPLVYKYSYLLGCNTQID